MGRADTDSRGRPVVVVTGTGVVTSLGAGQQDNWRELTAGHSGIRRITRFPIGGLRTNIAGTVDFVPVDELSAPALSRADRRTGCRRGSGRSRHRHAGRFSRTDVPGAAAGGVGMAAAPRAGRRLRRQRSRQLRRSAARRSDRKVRALLRALPVRLGRGKPGGALRHQGIAGGDLHRLRIGRHRDSARCRGDPPRRGRGGAGGRHRCVGESRKA